MPFLLFVVGLAVLFVKPLVLLVTTAATSELYSHILLIPFVSGYLIYLRREQLSAISQRSIVGAAVLFAAGLCALAAAFVVSWFRFDASNHLFFIILAFTCFVSAGGYLFLGQAWMRSLAFPFVFLVFLAPLPVQAINWLEMGSQIASAEAADLFFTVSGTPILRDGMAFQLPGMMIRVAQECSGIRSSLVLFITSLVAADLFLHSAWRRLFLVAFVIPLGIVRNGFRIFVIGLLCVHYGPQMIDSMIHRHGGPLFFAFSLIPLFLLLWYLRIRESKRGL